MNKILKSTFVIIGILTLAASATIAFYSDNETSGGNEFTAGKLNLQIDSECHYWDCPYETTEKEQSDCLNGEIKCPLPECIEKDCEDFGNWDLTDLTGEKFFNFYGLSILDHGEDTISYHVEDNNAYGCFSLTAKTGDNCTECEPEESTPKALTSINPTTFELITTGIGNCAENDGQNPNCVEKIEWTDNDTTKTFTTTEGIVSTVYIKAGTTCYKYTEDTTSDDYTVTGIGTSTIIISEGGTRCKDISHTEYVVCKDPLNYIHFFSWHDDGDNVYEPQNSEIDIFGPIPVTDLFEAETFAIADPIIGEIIAGQTGHIGLSWCVGDMNIDTETGEITCTAPVEECLCGGSGGTVCLDIDFYVEQARHNLNFTCDESK